MCPRCGADIEVVVPEHMLRHDTPLRTRVRCQCGFARAVFVERRASTRRKVQLDATLVLEKDSDEHTVQIQDLSRFGLSFETPEDTGLDPGQHAELAFELNPGRPQPFRKRIVIRWVDGTRVGAELTAPRGRDPYDPVYDLALAQHECPPPNR